MNQQMQQMYGKRLNTTTIEVPIKNLDGKYFLPDDAILRGKTIIEVFAPGNPQNDAYSPGTDAALPAPQAYRSAYVTLKCQNKSFLDNHPLIDLVITENDREHRLIEVDGFNPSKSFIIVANPTSPANKIELGEVFLLTFVYLD